MTLMKKYKTIAEKENFYLREASNLSQEEIRTINCKKRFNKMQAKLHILGASDYDFLNNSHSDCSFFYKIQLNHINIIHFNVSNINKPDEKLSYKSYKINKNDILSVSEIVIKTYISKHESICIDCVSEILRVELMDLISYFLFSKTKKSIGIVNI
jgi:hypothetical protein